MESLAKACEDGRIPGKIVGVFADRDCLGLQAAEKLEIPARKVEPSGFDTRDAWSEAFRDAVKGCDPDLVVSAGFMRILAPVFVDEFEGRLINLHPSLLPSFRGAHAVREALEAGVRVTGSTVHFVDHGVDEGPILIQEAVRVEQHDTEEDLHHRIKETEHRILPQACRLILEGRVRLEGRRVLIEHD
jgi:phosphoribosylglycinamide formyltransferase-1